MKGSIYPLPLASYDISLLSLATFHHLFIQKPSVIIKIHITNKSNTPIYISLDGVHDHDVILPDKDLILDFPHDGKGLLHNGSYFIRVDEFGKGTCYIATYCLNIGV